MIYCFSGWGSVLPQKMTFQNPEYKAKIRGEDEEMAQ